MDRPCFAQRVYQVVRCIPPGKVATYGQIAFLAGAPGAARAAGTALKNCSQSGIPCHRVVNSRGTMAPGNTFGGEKAQKEQLVKEGVLFLKNGCVDFSVSLWKGE